LLPETSIGGFIFLEAWSQGGLNGVEITAG